MKYQRNQLGVAVGIGEVVPTDVEQLGGGVGAIRAGNEGIGFHTAALAAIAVNAAALFIGNGAHAHLHGVVGVTCKIQVVVIPEAVHGGILVEGGDASLGIVDGAAAHGLLFVHSKEGNVLRKHLKMLQRGTVSVMADHPDHQFSYSPLALMVTVGKVPS